MNKGLEELKRLAYENACCRCQYYINNQCANNNECVWKTIEKELKQAEKNEIVLNAFKNALTIEHHDLPMVDPHDDSEDIVTSFVRQFFTIKQNELDKGLRQALREWVLKNAFPREMQALKIIIYKKVNVGEFLVLINKDTTYEQYEYLYENRDKILGDSLTTFNAKLNKNEFEVIKESILCHW